MPEAHTHPAYVKHDSQGETVLSDDEHYMKEALREAQRAREVEEVPIGAVVVYNHEIIARAHNLRETSKSPSAHAEFLAMQQASEVLDRWRLFDCSVYVTLEPCLMCAGLMLNARVDRCVFATRDPKAGALGSLYDVSHDVRLNHEFEVCEGVLADDASLLLKEFFKARRAEAQAIKRARVRALAQEMQGDDIV